MAATLLGAVVVGRAERKKTKLMKAQRGEDGMRTLKTRTRTTRPMRMKRKRLAESSKQQECGQKSAQKQDELTPSHAAEYDFV